MKLLSHVPFFVTPQTVAYRAPQSMEFSRQEYWSELPFPSPGDFPNPGIEPQSPELQADALLSEPPGKPSVQFSSFTQSCPTLFNPMNRSMPGPPVHPQLPEFTQTHVHREMSMMMSMRWTSAISTSVVPFSSCPQSFPASGSFPMSQISASGGQSIGVSALTSVLLMNTKD